MRKSNNKMRTAAPAITCIIAIVLLALPVALSPDALPDEFAPFQASGSSAQVIQADSGQTPLGDGLASVESERQSVPGSQGQAGSASPAASDAGPKYESGVVLVDFAPGVTAEQALESFAADKALAGVSVKEQMGFCTELSLPDALSVEDAVELLSASDMVNTVEPNYYLSVADDTAAPAVASNEADSPRAKNASERSAISPALVAGFPDSLLATAGDQFATEDDQLATADSQLAATDDQLATQDAITPNDRHYSAQWALPSVNAPQAWEAVPDPSTAADAVVVAVADNGFDLSNPDFNIVNRSNPKDLANDVVYPYNAASRQEIGYSDVAYPDASASSADHGTHVAGIVAAQANNAKGVAGSVYNKCKVMPIRLSDDVGDMTTLSLSYAMQYVITAKGSGLNVRVLNMSVGVNSRVRGETLQRAINAATEAGIVIVAAACNRGDSFRTLPSEAYPSDYDNVVSVINLRQDGSSADAVARDTDSNFNTATQMAKDISAPGTNIVSTSFKSNSYLNDPWYTQKSGTSMASPLVAGVLGLMFTAEPTLTAKQATSKLYSSAKDLTSSSGASAGWDRATGYGEVDAAQAVAASTPYISGKTVMGAGSSETFAVMASGAEASGYTWSTSDSSVATIDPTTGKLTAVVGGEVIVKAANGANTAQQTLKVYGISGSSEIPIGLGATYSISPDSSDSWVWSVTASDGSPTPYASINRSTGALTTTSSSDFTAPQTIVLKATSAYDVSVVVKKEVTIISNEISDANTTVTFDTVTYNGSYQQPVPTVVESGTTLEYNKHFTVQWRNNLNAGTAEATIEAISPLTGTLTKSFTINKAPMTLANIRLSATSFTFESNSKKKAPTVASVYDIGLNSSIMYYYPNNYTYVTNATALGTGTVRITATSSCRNFTGTATRTFTVSASWQPMYRLYNPNSGEHFYTASAAERSHLVQVGWRNENIGWYAPTTGDNVYRLYNPNAGDHHYTTSSSERRSLLSVGWRDEGVGWKSGGTTPLYREYNPNAVAGAHNYTTSLSEHNYLCGIGWRNENTAWYGR